MNAKYYALYGGINIAREVGVDYAYLDKSSGKWVRDNSLIGAITGYDGDASTHEISKQDAQRWVKENHPKLRVRWV